MAEEELQVEEGGKKKGKKKLLIKTSLRCF